MVVDRPDSKSPLRSSGARLPPARALPRDFGIRLGRVVTSIATTVGPEVHVGVLAVDGWIRTAHGSDAAATRVNHAQFDRCDGPGAQPGLIEETLRSHDLAREHRWPHFAAVAVEMGVRSVLCHRSALAGTLLLSINLYSRQIAAFDEESVALIWLLSVGAAQVLTGTGRRQAGRTDRR